MYYNFLCIAVTPFCRACLFHALLALSAFVYYLLYIYLRIYMLIFHTGCCSVKTKDAFV